MSKTARLTAIAVLIFLAKGVARSAGDACPTGSGENGECSSPDLTDSGVAKGSTEGGWSLDNIPILTDQVRIAGPATPAHFARLMEWARENGAEISTKVRLGEADETSTGVRGLVLTEDAEEDEELIKIPSSIWLSTSQGMNIMEGIEYSFPKNEIMEGVNWYLAVKLLVEMQRGEESFYKPYLDFLPTCPSVWCLSRQELDQASEFEPTEGVISPRRRVSLLKSVYDTVHALSWQVVNEFPYEKVGCKPFTFEEMLWALGMVTSRSFRTDLVVKDELSMAPVADLPNHSDDSRLMHIPIRNSSGHVIYKCPGDRKAGDEILLRYHEAKRDIDLLVVYGFVPDINAKGRVYDLTVGVKHRELSRKAKELGLWQEFLPTDDEGVGYSERILGDGLPSGEFMGFVRSVAATSDRIAVDEKNNLPPLFNVSDISPQVMRGEDNLTRDVEILAITRILDWLKRAQKMEKSDTMELKLPKEVNLKYWLILTEIKYLEILTHAFFTMDNLLTTTKFMNMAILKSTSFD